MSVTTRPIGYVAADVEGHEPTRLIELVAAVGYEAIDWTMEQHDPLEAPASELVAIARAARTAGLATPQLMVHQDYVTPDGAAWEERVRRSELAVEAAAAAEIPSIGVVTGPNRWADGWTPVGVDGLDPATAWDLARRALERVLARADALGVIVALEPCWGTLAHDRATADRALAALASPALGVTVDPSHFVMTRDDVPSMIRAWADRIAHVHLKDAFGVPGIDGEDFLFLLPGEGGVDWTGMLDALDEVGYAGAMSVEFEAFRLRNQVLRGDIERGAEVALRCVAGLLSGRAAGRGRGERGR